MKDITYFEFTKSIVKSKQRLPLQGHIELTYRCPYKCKHCYCKNESKEEKGALFWRRILKNISDLGGLSVTLTGGDPILHPDFIDIYKYAKSLGFLINVFTTGYHLDDNIIEEFKINPPLNIEITLNSLKASVYEDIVQRQGSFKKTMRTIKEIKSLSLPLILKCNGLKQNKTEVLKIKEFSSNLLGEKRFKFDSFIFPCMNREDTPKKYRLSPKDITKIEKSDYDMFLERVNSFKGEEEPICVDRLYNCKSWWSSYYINPSGKLKFCSISDNYSSDLSKISFEQGFDKFSKVLTEKPNKVIVCNECNIRKYCNWCPERAFLETGSRYLKVDYYCDLAKETKSFLKNCC